MATADRMFFTAPIKVQIELIEPDPAAFANEWAALVAGYDPAGNGAYLVGPTRSRFWRDSGISADNTRCRIKPSDLARLPRFQTIKESGPSRNKRKAG